AAEADKLLSLFREWLTGIKHHRGVEFIAEAWADYERARANALGAALQYKKRPALSTAKEVRAKGKELAVARREAKRSEWIVQLYEWHFPWLSELRDVEEDASYVEEAAAVKTEVGDRDHPASAWLTRPEWEALPTAERNQLALDRYLRSRKTPWQLGRDYERYIGFLREGAGCKVTYHGIFQGLEDLGRDVLAEKDGHLEVIQCKRWAQRKTIHEKHVFQLFGTTVLARLENPTLVVNGTFTTTTTLSPKAREVAEHLGIKIEEGFPLADYPRIGCNIARPSGERIYHLPFDQQYDKTVIEPERGESYVMSVAEAEANGSAERGVGAGARTRSTHGALGGADEQRLRFQHLRAWAVAQRDPRLGGL
nr:restriction endonuclease [Solirubrobacterales bacterium]